MSGTFFNKTKQCLVKMLEKWKYFLDNGFNIGVLFVDPSKAFGVLNHPLLLAKLDAYGFFPKSTTFIQSHINKRLHNVNVNNEFSAWEHIYSGVPQGLILIPLLNVFINDIFSFLTTCDMCSYADDNTLYTYIWSLILVNVNSWALEKPMRMRYLPIIKSDLKKLLLRNCLV